MIEVSTKRHTMTLMVDGEPCEIPLTFTAHELVEMNRSGQREAAMFDFFSKYVPGFDSMGDDALNAILSEWTRLREEIGEPDMGE